MEFQEKKNPNFLLSTAQPFGMGNPEPSYFLTQPTNVNNSTAKYYIYVMWLHNTSRYKQQAHPCYTYARLEICNLV